MSNQTITNVFDGNNIDTDLFEAGYENFVEMSLSPPCEADPETYATSMLYAAFKGFQRVKEALREKEESREKLFDEELEKRVLKVIEKVAAEHAFGVIWGRASEARKKASGPEPYLD